MHLINVYLQALKYQYWINIYFQALKMKYFSQKPAPTPGPQLPLPGNLPAVIKEPEIKTGSKRKHDVIESGQYILVNQGSHSTGKVRENGEK